MTPTDLLASGTDKPAATGPTKTDFIAVLQAVQDGMPLTLYQHKILIAALRIAAGDYGPNATGGSFAALQRAADIPEAAPAKPEISLLPALLAKMTESCDLLREMRDMMRCKNPKLVSE